MRWCGQSQSAFVVSDRENTVSLRITLLQSSKGLVSQGQSHADDFLFTPRCITCRS
jgi:hypothetical protein